MTKFIVHIRRHCGWHTTEAEGATFAEAAIAAVIATCKQYGLDVDKVPHKVSFNERDKDYMSVVFREDSYRQVFRHVTSPGELWFADQVRQGHEDDCTSCGATGVSHYNPFMQCWACGDRKMRGKGTGLARVAQAA